MSWHDAHVHALRIVAGEYGAGNFSLDLDYILEWHRGLDNIFSFHVAAAELTFREVTGLRMSLDYAAMGAEFVPFSIEGIEREIIDYGYRRKITVNWPSGEIVFESPGFDQRLTGPVVETSSQHLNPMERST
jgi:hypothetical protein